MSRRTKASRRAAFRRHCALPVRYTKVSTRERQRFMDALRPRVLSVTEAPGGRVYVVPFGHVEMVTVELGWGP